MLCFLDKGNVIRHITEALNYITAFGGGGGGGGGGSLQSRLSYSFCLSSSFLLPDTIGQSGQGGRISMYSSHQLDRCRSLSRKIEGPYGATFGALLVIYHIYIFAYPSI